MVKHLILLFLFMVPALLYSLDLEIPGVPFYTCSWLYRKIAFDNIDMSKTIGELKAKIMEQSGLPVANQELYFSGNKYSDETKLESIPNINDKISIVLQVKK